MPITLTDSDGIQEVHISERLEIDLLSAEEDIKKMTMRIWFNVETRLPSGKPIGQPYWDSQRVLELSCENDPELEAAMTIIQTRIGQKRYEQITAPPEISKLVESPGMPPPAN